MNAELLADLLDLLPPDTTLHAAVLQAASLAYETALADGLCHAGALECAAEAVRAPGRVTERPAAPAGRADAASPR